MKLKIKELSNVLLATLMISATGYSSVLDWKGGYRFEYTEIEKPSLTNPGLRKSFGTNYLYLSPKLIASDGVNIISRFEVFASQDTYYNSYLGTIWGQGNSNTSAASGSPSKSNTLGRNSESLSLKVSQLYLNVNQENASLILGRAPFEFGIGMNYSSGDGLFDHWNNNRDMFAYKVLVGNLTLMPLFARHYDDGFAQGGMVQDEGLLVQYDNKETGSLIGVMLERRKASMAVNDVPVDTTVNPGAVGDSYSGDYNVQKTNFILGRDWDSFGFRLEAGFLSGDLGVVKSGQNVRATGYGIASEWYLKTDSNWNYNLRLGVASGDNPDTSDYEGFQFDRNYDVAFLMFNHRLGSYDVLRTGAIKESRSSANLNAGNTVDDEAISNAYYISPVIKYRWNEKLDFNQYITWAQLVTSPIANQGAKKDLGFEWDLEFSYKVREKMKWVNQVGFLFPGSAFKTDAVVGSDNKFTFGYTSKIGIQF